ncbi:MAG TPA: hypothetical protein VGW33_00230 [Terriglobia bacterium]|nr:hypothetical protein [Terriglobia bacterium]
MKRIAFRAAWLGLTTAWMLAPGPPAALAAARQPAQQAPAHGTDEIKLAQQGMHRLMNADFSGAADTFRQIQKSDPESPLGYVLEADVDWWKIYLTRGNLIDPDVFESLSEAVTPYDPDFNRLTDAAIEKAEAGIHAHKNEAFNDLCEGLAYALQGRLEALRAHALATARDGKKMRNLSLAALKLDPSLADADLGVGLYNYFEATLPGYVRMLRFLIGLPGGDRRTGLRQLREAAEKGELVRPEAEFQLAKNLSRRIEQQYPKSLAMFEQLVKDYPDNPLWRLLVGSLELRMGQAVPGAASYREAIKLTAPLDPSIWKPLRHQAEKALARRHPEAGAK